MGKTSQRNVYEGGKPSVHAWRTIGMDKKKGFIEVYAMEQYNDIKRGIK